MGGNLVAMWGMAIFLCKNVCLKRMYLTPSMYSVPAVYSLNIMCSIWSVDHVHTITIIINVSSKVKRSSNFVGP